MKPLEHICSTIATKHLQAGDIVECVGGYRLPIGGRYVIDKIIQSTWSENCDFVKLKERPGCGYFAHEFKKTNG